MVGPTVLRSLHYKTEVGRPAPHGAVYTFTLITLIFENLFPLIKLFSKMFLSPKQTFLKSFLRSLQLFSKTKFQSNL